MGKKKKNYFMFTPFLNLTVMRCPVLKQPLCSLSVLTFYADEIHLQTPVAC